jgi:hypothetical protein
MKVFTFGRAVRLAMLGGAIYYVRKHGGVRSTWNQLVEKARPLAEQAKQKMGEVSQNMGQGLGQQGQGIGQQGESLGQQGQGLGSDVAATDPMYQGSTTGAGTGIPDFSDPNLGNKSRY